ncbi:hypothetical protein [Algibacter sp.]|uniref:hypothetical protein n=1 Tax=Algibacter sp. TaxID=1872428 RepID=UPI003C7750A2
MFRTKRLTEKEKAFIPYTANQILIFESNKSKTDTITITEISLTKHPPNLGDMFWAKNTEVLRVQTDVNCKNCDEIMYLGTENFSFDTNISWTIRLNEKNYTFGTNQKSIDKIEKIKSTVNGIEYDDVLVLERAKQFERPKDNISKMFYKGIYPIDKLYWSKSNGIIKFEIIETNEIWKIKNALQHSI